ncbi:MAG: tripeptide aminopeptidase [Solirubrobacteraceae bacterium]|nr:tripeptide aminopeptidase [Solirubrobacteraceae bacterium]
MRRADAGERERLHGIFSELCRIESPFGHERACADRVAGELRALGLEVSEDGAAGQAGAQCGNLLARIEGAADASFVLCAHLDTVALAAPVEPVLVEGGWENANDGVLGADNKAAVAVLLELARRCSIERPPIGIELLFTVSEENALAGAKAFDVGALRSDFGYVFDHASPIGEVVLSSPTYYRLGADFHGASAHAGIRPEDGRSAIAAAAHAIAAMRLGRLDEETTANVSRIDGGGPSTNVVPERCRIEAEARSLDDAKVESVVAELVDRVHDGANAAECDVDVTVERLFLGYRTRPSAPQVGAAEAALRACGYEPQRIVSGGASDANAFEAAGFACTNLANGTERNHQPDERVSAAALEGMLDVAFALVSTVAEC